MLGGVAAAKLTSRGKIIIDSAASIGEIGDGDAGVELIADELDLKAATGIIGIETAAKKVIQAISTTGDVELADLEGVEEMSRGLLVEEAVASAGSVKISAVDSLVVDFVKAVGANTVAELKSETGNLLVQAAPAGEAYSVQAGGGIALEAGVNLRLVGDVNAPDSLVFVAGKEFVTSVGEELSFSAKNIRLESGTAVVVDGTLKADESVEIVSNAGNVTVTGTIEGSTPGSSVKEVSLVARGNRILEEGSLYGYYKFKDSLPDPLPPDPPDYFYSLTPEPGEGDEVFHLVGDVLQKVEDPGAYRFTPVTVEVGQVNKHEYSGYELYRKSGESISLKDAAASLTHTSSSSSSSINNHSKVKLRIEKPSGTEGSTYLYDPVSKKYYVRHKADATVVANRTRFSFDGIDADLVAAVPPASTVIATFYADSEDWANANVYDANGTLLLPSRYAGLYPNLHEVTDAATINLLVPVETFFKTGSIRVAETNIQAQERISFHAQRALEGQDLELSVSGPDGVLEISTGLDLALNSGVTMEAAKRVLLSSSGIFDKGGNLVGGDLTVSGVIEGPSGSAPKEVVLRAFADLELNASATATDRIELFAGGTLGGSSLNGASLNLDATGADSVIDIAVDGNVNFGGTLKASKIALASKRENLTVSANLLGTGGNDLKEVDFSARGNLAVSSVVNATDAVRFKAGGSLSGVNLNLSVDEVIEISTGDALNFGVGSVLKADKRISLVSTGGNLTFAGTAEGKSTAGALEEIVLKAKLDLSAQAQIAASRKILLEAGGSLTSSAGSLDLLAAGSDGNIDIITGDDLQLNGKLEAVEQISLLSGGKLTLSSSSELTGPGSAVAKRVLLASKDDLEVNGKIEASEEIDARAGTDGVGSVKATAGSGLIDAGSGIVKLISGATAGIIDMDLVTISAKDVSVDSTGEVALSLDAESLSALVDSGNLVVTASGALRLTDVEAKSGSIEVSAAGKLEADRVIASGGADAHDITLKAVGAASDLIYDEVKASGSGDMLLEAGAGIAAKSSVSSITADEISFDGQTSADLVGTFATLSGEVHQAGDMTVSAIGNAVFESLILAAGKANLAATGNLTVDLLRVTNAGDAHDLSIDVGGNLVLGELDAGSTGDISLKSTGSITKTAGKRVRGDELALEASGSVNIATEVATIVASLSAAGDLQIDETNALQLVDVSVADGSLDVTTGASLTVDSARISTDETGREAKLKTISGDISVGVLVVGTDKGKAVLDAAGDIKQSTTDETADVLGHELVVQVGGDFLLDVDVDQLSGTATGAFRVTDLDDLVLGDLKSLAGPLEVEALGRLVVGGSIESGSTLLLEAKDLLVETSGSLLAQDALTAEATNQFRQLGETRSVADVVTLAAGGFMEIAGAVSSLAKKLLTLRSDEDLILKADISNEGGNILLKAEAGTISQDAGKIVIADELELRTKKGTSLTTRVDSLVASVSSAGDLSITELDALELEDVEIFLGDVTVVAGGELTATDVSIQAAGSGNLLSLQTTRGALLNVGKVSAGSLGKVSLTSDARMVMLDMSASVVEAGELSVTAKAAVSLLTDVESLALVVESGDAEVTETDDLNLGTVEMRSGSLSLEVGGNLDIFSDAGLKVADELSLKTTAGDLVLSSQVGGYGSNALDKVTIVVVGDLSLDSVVEASDLIDIKASGSLSSSRFTLKASGTEGSIALETGESLLFATGSVMEAVDSLLLVSTSGDVVLSGDLLGLGGKVVKNIEAEAAGTLSVISTAKAKDRVTLKATDFLVLGNLSQVVASGESSTIEIVAGKDATLGGLVSGADEVTLTVADDAIVSGQVSSSGKLTLKTGQDVANSGSVLGEGSGKISAEVLEMTTGSSAGEVLMAGQLLAAADLSIISFGSVQASLEVDSLSLETKSVGDVELVGKGLLELEDVTVLSGFFRVQSDSLDAKLLRLLGTGDTHDAHLITTTGDLRVGNVTMGAGRDIVIESEAAVSMLVSNGKLSSDALRVSAVKGIALRTDVSSLIAEVSGVGLLSLIEENDLDVDFMRVAAGSLSLSAGGAVEVSEAKATGGQLSLEAGDILGVGTVSAGSGKVILKGKSLTMLSAAEGELSSLVSAWQVDAEAAGDIDLDLAASYLSLKTTGVGVVNIEEADSLVVNSAEVADGALGISAEGDLRVNGLKAFGTGVIDLRANKGTLALGNIDAGSGNIVRANASGKVTNWTGRVTAEVTELTAGGSAVIDLAGGALEVELLEAGDLIILSTGDLSVRKALLSKGSVNANVSGSLSVDGVELLSDNWIYLKASGEILQGSISAGAKSGTVTLVTPAQISATADAKRISASEVVARAGGAVSLNIDGGSLSIETTAKGDVAVDAAGSLVIADGKLSRGNFLFSAEGDLEARKVFALAPGADLRFVSSQGSIELGDVRAGFRSEVSADAAKTIFMLEGGRVVADAVKATAGRGLSLDLRAVSLEASVTKGDVSVTEVDALVVEKLHLAGSGVVKAGGDLTILEGTHSGRVSLLAESGGQLLAGEVDLGESGVLGLHASKEVMSLEGKILTSGKIVVRADNRAVLSTTAQELDATVTGTGKLSLTEADTLDIIANLSEVEFLRTTNSGDISFVAEQSIDLRDVFLADGSFTAVVGGHLSSDVLVLGAAGKGVSLKASGAITLAEVDAGEKGTVSLEASGDVNVSGKGITAKDLFVAAEGAVYADLSVEEVILRSNGDVFLQETDSLVVADAKLTDGSLTIAAAGDLRVSQASTGGDARQVNLNAQGGSLFVGDIDFGADGEARLEALGSIEQIRGKLIIAGRAKVLAGDKVALVSSIKEVSLVAGGDVSLTNENALVVKDVQTGKGVVKLQAKGDLTIQNLSLADDVAGNVVSLLAKGGGNLSVGAFDAGSASEVKAESGGSFVTTKGGLLRAGSLDALVHAGGVELSSELRELNVFLETSGDVTILEADDLLVGKAILAQGNVTFETSGAIEVSEIFAQSAEVTSGGTTKLTGALGDLTLLSSGDAEVTESDDLLVNSLEVSQGSLSLTVGGNLSATLAKASANATLKVGGTGVVKKLSAGSNLSIETGGLLDVSDILGQSAEVISGGTTKLTSALGDLTLLSSGDAEVTESDDLLVNSLEVSQGSLSLTVGGNLSATLAKASANATLKVGGTGVVRKTFGRIEAEHRDRAVCLMCPISRANPRR